MSQQEQELGAPQSHATAPSITSCWSQDGVSLTRHTDTGIFVLTLDRGPNVFHPTLVSLLSQALTLVEEAAHPKALIITGKGKFFSNGLDLEYFNNTTTTTRNNHAERSAFIESLWRWLARLLVLDCRTVAAMNGHAFGAGLFMALAADVRVMQIHRGYLCWPEMNLGMRLAKGFAELTKAKISTSNGDVWRQGVLESYRYNAQEALQAGIIHHACPKEEELATRAYQMAVAGLPQTLGLQNFQALALQQIKTELYTDAYRALTMAKADDPPHCRL